jgi:UDP-glucose 4-epimerase
MTATPAKSTNGKSHILVTGGAGFIGSHLVERLLATGARVVVLDNFRNGRRGNLPDPAQEPRLQIVEGDIRDRETCARCCQDADTVFHLACLGLRHSLHNPMENQEVNALGTLQVLEAARRAAVRRFVYMSTSEIYGRASDFPITEQTCPWPLTAYGASKLAGEHYARVFAECYQLNTVCVRAFNNYGPRSHFEGDAGEALPSFILRALNGLPPVIFGDGSITRDFMHVRDCAEALCQIAGCDALRGRVVNLGYGSETRIGDLALAVLAAVGRTDLQPEFHAPRPADLPRLWADESLLRSLLPFAPRMSLKEGLPETVAYFAELNRRDPDILAKVSIRNWEKP